MKKIEVRRNEESFFDVIYMLGRWLNQRGLQNQQQHCAHKSPHQTSTHYIHLPSSSIFTHTSPLPYSYSHLIQVPTYTKQTSRGHGCQVSFCYSEEGTPPLPPPNLSSHLFPTRLPPSFPLAHCSSRNVHNHLLYPPRRRECQWVASKDATY